MMTTLPTAPRPARTTIVHFKLRNAAGRVLPREYRMCLLPPTKWDVAHVADNATEFAEYVLAGFDHTRDRAYVTAVYC